MTATLQHIISASLSGAALPLTERGLNTACSHLNCHPSDLWAVIAVETHGVGYNPNRSLQILFERHIFARLTSGRHNAAHPDISNRTPGGYGRAGAHQWGRIKKAGALDAQAAIESASWGLPQIMGFNARAAGYPTNGALGMIRAFADSEDAQVLALARFIEHVGIADALRERKWATFARAYNGPGYAKHDYDGRLARAHAAARTRMPSLFVRAQQIALLFRGVDPGPIDGLMGRRTEGAIAEYAERHDIESPDSPLIGEHLLRAAWPKHDPILSPGAIHPALLHFEPHAPAARLPAPDPEPKPELETEHDPQPEHPAATPATTYRTITLYRGNMLEASMLARRDKATPTVIEIRDGESPSITIRAPSEH
jgi:peptidoglycan hydrolase-like protein with peptidoglycan-binding domain